MPSNMRSTTTHYVNAMSSDLSSNIALIPRKSYQRWQDTRPPAETVRAAPTAANDAASGEHEIRFVTSERVITTEDGESVLEAGLREDIDLAFSCTLGGCGTCRVRLLKGQVDMLDENALSDEEIAEGWILACSSKPLSALEIEA